MSIQLGARTECYVAEDLRSMSGTEVAAGSINRVKVMD